MRSLFHFAWRDFSSQRIKVAVSVLSVFIAVMSSVFFFALSEGAKRATFLKVEQSLGFNELQVKPKYGVTMFKVTKEEINPVTPALKEKIEALPEVEKVYTQMQVQFLSSMEIELFNSRFESDSPIYGVDAEALEEQYSDFEYENYKDEDYVPVIVATDLVDLYNSGLADAVGKPKLNEAVLLGLEFDFKLGYSSFFSSGNEDVTTIPAKIIGYSDRTPLMGFTIPMGYVREFNKEFAPEKQGENEVYSELLVRVKDQKDVEKVAALIESWDYSATSLQDKIKGISENLQYLTFIMGIISLIIIAISALNVLGTIFSIVSEKTRMIGTLRAMGAKRSQIAGIFLWESFFIGLFGGVLGTLAGVGAAVIVNNLLLQDLPFFSGAGVSLIYLSPEMVIGACLLSILFSMLSGLYPALRASHLSPKVALQR